MVGVGGGGMDKAALASSMQARLQKIVLSWDYLRLLSQSKANQKKRKLEKADSSLRSVPGSFKDFDEYLAVFEPLLLEEVRAQIVRGEEEEGSLDWEMAAVMKCEKAHEFYFVQAAVEAHVIEKLTDSDVILLSKDKFQVGSAVPTIYAFASVEAREGKQILKVRMFLDGEFSGETKIMQSGRLSKMRTALQATNSAWWLLKLNSLSTIMREYTALQSMCYLPFSDIILSGKPRGTNLEVEDMPSDSHWSVPQNLMDYLTETHNESQLDAIKAGLTSNPIVLIQGPPGTGKTQTILGILSVVLHAIPARLPAMGNGLELEPRPELSIEEKVQHWLKASPWLGHGGNPRDAIMAIDGDDGFYPTSGTEFRPETVGAKRKHRVHVLVCAPSNSALDEIVLRLMNTGLRDEEGQSYTPSIVRAGLNAHHSVQSVSMDYLLEQRLSSMDRSTAASGPRAGMERDRMRLAILEEAAIVCSTLSYSGAGVFQRMTRGFDVVVIDEAAQAVESSTLVPLTHGCKKVFMVGDPLQLPATVISAVAVQLGYSKSMFKRFQQAGYPVQMLKTQYRMHPQIREFPSKEFYDDALEDGKKVIEETKRPWHEHRCFGPFGFFDIAGEETQPSGSGSWVNYDEADFVLVLYRHLVARHPQLKGAPNIAVISPYKQQVKILRERFREVLGAEASRFVDVNTVDGFQGREKDVAIFSCVRANEGKGIGFVSDYRRMNVGLTRARASMLVVGSASTLMQDKHWSSLVTTAKKRHCFFKVAKPFHTLFSEGSLASMKQLDEGELAHLGSEEKTSKENFETGMEEQDRGLDQDLLVEATENYGDLDVDDEEA